MGDGHKGDSSVEGDKRAGPASAASAEHRRQSTSVKPSMAEKAHPTERDADGVLYENGEYMVGLTGPEDPFS